LLNTSKRDARIREEEEAKEKASRKDKFIDDMMAEIDDLKADLKSKEVDKQEYDKNKNILHDLYDKGVIDGEGNLL
jgi:predicted transcriptional regulator YheO